MEGGLRVGGRRPLRRWRSAALVWGHLLHSRWLQSRHWIVSSSFILRFFWIRFLRIWGRESRYLRAVFNWSLLLGLYFAGRFTRCRLWGHFLLLWPICWISRGCKLLIYLVLLEMYGMLFQWIWVLNLTGIIFMSSFDSKVINSISSYILNYLLSITYLKKKCICCQLLIHNSFL